MSRHDTLLRLNVRVGGSTLRAIVDSGATGSFIASRCLRGGLVSSKTGASLPVEYGDGRTVECGRVVRQGFTVPSLGLRCQHDLLAIPLPASFDVVLGLDWMRTFRARLDPALEGDVLTIAGGRAYLFGSEERQLQDATGDAPPPEQPEQRQNVYEWSEGGASARLNTISAGMAEASPEDAQYLLFVRVAEQERRREIEAFLAGTRTALRADSLLEEDRARLRDAEDEVAATTSETVARELQAVLDCHRDRHGFDEPTMDTVAVRDDEVEPLRLTPEGLRHPPYEPPRRLNGPKLEALRKYLDELLARGFIRPSKSSFGAPVLLVVKTDGTYRFTVDYRRLNEVTETDRFCLPRPDQIFQQIKQAGAKVFSAIDAFHSFWQVRLRPEDRAKTAMSTPFGLYEWLVCPQGLASSPGTLQRVLTTALGDLVGTICAVYLDDILIYSATPEEHVVHLRQVLDRLHAAQIRIKEKKCKFMRSSLEYLGVRLSGQGTAPTVVKLRQLADFPEPTCRQDVKSLLGVISWLRDYVPHVVTWTLPLQRLANARTPWTATTWTDEHRRCLEVVLHLLISAPVLATPDSRKAFVLMTDASEYALGCVLLQKQDDGLLHPVAYHSKALKARKRHLSPTDREMLGILEGIKKWQHLLADQERLYVLGDHQPLSHYRKMDLSKGHSLILRQLDRLEGLRTEITYATAREVALADLLSRDPRHRALAEAALHKGLQHPALRFGALLTGVGMTRFAPPRHTLGTIVLPDQTRVAGRAELVAAQGRDAQLSGVLQRQALAAEAGHRGPAPSITHDADGLAWHTSPDGHRRLFVPDGNLRASVLRHAHDDVAAGHLGSRRTLERVRRHYWWPTLSKDVRAYCASCAVCASSKAGGRKRCELSPMAMPFRKWAYVSLDFVSGLGDGEYKSALVVCDMLTKRIRVIPTQRALDVATAERLQLTAEETARLYFQEIWRHHGLPTRIVSDRDPRFTASFWAELWRRVGTHLNMSTAGYPQTDGQTERSIRTFVQMLRAFVHHHGKDRWHELVPALEYAYNDSVHASTGYTPFALEFGQHPHTPLQLWLDAHMDGDSAAAEQVQDTGPRAFLARMRLALNDARARVRASQDTAKRYHDRLARRQRVAAGDWVWVENASRLTKLDPVYVGPFRVSQVRGQVVTIARSGRRFHKVNMSKTRRFQPRADVSGELEDSRVTDHADADEVDVQQLQVQRQGQWAPVLRDLEADAGAAWPRLAEFFAAASRESGDTLHPGLLVSKSFPGFGWSDGLIVEHDPHHEQAFRVVYYDGVSEDVSAAEARRLHDAWRRRHRVR